MTNNSVSVHQIEEFSLKFETFQPMSAGKRERFSFAEKYTILQELDKGTKQRLSKKNMGFIKNQVEIVAYVKKPSRMDAKNTGQSNFPDLDLELLEWFRNMRSQSSDVSISGADLLGKAEEIAQKLKNTCQLHWICMRCWRSAPVLACALGSCFSLSSDVREHNAHDGRETQPFFKV